MPHRCARQALHRPRTALAGLLAGSLLLAGCLLRLRQRLVAAPRTLLTVDGTADPDLSALDAGGGCPAAAPEEDGPSPFDASCVLLRDACVDHERIILYGAAALGEPAYTISPQNDSGHRMWKFEVNTTGPADFGFHLAPIRVRPREVRAEPTPYLRQPLFAGCTVPVVWFPYERVHNFCHLFRDNAAKLYGALRQTPWASRAKLVVVTAEGLALPPWTLSVLQPLFRLGVETWADFSSRLPARRLGGGYVPAAHSAQPAAAALPPPSAEGGPQRCFRRLYVCTEGRHINIPGWPIHALGQHLVRHYQPELAAVLTANSSFANAEQPDGAAVAAAARPQGQLAAGERSNAAAAMPAVEQVQRALRILFHRRDLNSSRQLLNAEELVERCNSWRHTTAAGRRLRASCAQASKRVETSDLLSGMAAAQEADVMVAMHGANLANGWMMRRGSSVVELQAYGFDAGAAHLQYPQANQQDVGSGVLWWLVSACDPASSSPGQEEAQGIGIPASYPKNRNLAVSWAAMRQVLEAVAEAGGNVGHYRRHTWPAGTWWWWMHDRLTPVGPKQPGLPYSKLRCPAPGDAPPLASGGGALDASA